MKPAVTLTSLLFPFVLPIVPFSAQEHVAVPLPAYDPPPKVSHHSEPDSDQAPHTARQSRSPAKASPGHPSPSKGRSVNSSSPHHSYHRPGHRRHVRHRRHSFFHWPWQHRK